MKTCLIERFSRLVTMMVITSCLPLFLCCTPVDPILPPDDTKDPVDQTEKPEKPEEVKTPEIEINGESEHVAYPIAANVPEEVRFTVKSLAEDGKVWAECDDDVMEVECVKLDGNNYKLTATATELFESEAKVTVFAANGDKQNKAEVNFTVAYLEIEKNEVAATMKPDTYTVNVSTNVQIAVEDNAEWLSAEVKEDKLMLNVSGNNTNRTREAAVTITDEHGFFKETVTVTQSGEAVKSNKERDALIAIYNALGGENWNDNRGWCTDAPLDQWTGVMTMELGGEEHVYYLHIRCQDAVGQLPEEIGDLEYLSELWIIQEPGITGTIPESIKNLKRVKDIRIAMTNISGEIPEFFKDMESLRSLSLYDNKLTGNLPLWLANKPNLESFGFEGNCLDGEVDETITKTGWWTTYAQNKPDTMMGDGGIYIGQKYPHRLWKPGHKDDIPTYYNQDDPANPLGPEDFGEGKKDDDSAAPSEPAPDPDQGENSGNTGGIVPDDDIENGGGGDIEY